MSEEDPTAIEPDENDLPPKPMVEGLPTDDELEAEDEPGDEDVPDDQFMSTDEAAADDTVDDTEQDE